MSCQFSLYKEANQLSVFVCIYMPSLLNLPPTPSYPTTLGHPIVRSLCPCAIQQVPTIYLMHCSVYIRLPWWFRHLPAMQETWVQSLGWEEHLEKEMAIHSSILCLGNSRQWSLASYCPRGCKKLDIYTECIYHYMPILISQFNLPPPSQEQFDSFSIP